MLLYQLRDLQQATLLPLRMAAGLAGYYFGAPFFDKTPFQSFAKHMTAQAKLVERNTRLYEKPSFHIYKTKFRGQIINVREVTVASHPFCHLLHFKRFADHPDIADHAANDPKVLIITPLSGHFSTLMRGTVEAMLPAHNVYITDWVDAKFIPIMAGPFGLHAQITYLMDIIRLLGPNLHIIAISQAAYSTLAAVSLLADDPNPLAPKTLSLLGGPIDASQGFATLRELALRYPLSWFKEGQIQLVPPYYPGAFRPVYPGFSQLQDRMALTLDRHINEQIKYYGHLVQGDNESAEVHEKFYDEFLSVMDVPAELYLDFVESAYQECALARGTLIWADRPANLGAIKETAILSVEGELDDLSPPGQTRAVLDLCANLPQEKKQAYLEISVGHYGIFSGKKWRNNIQPTIHKFIRKNS